MKVKHLNQICVGPTLSNEEIRKVKLALESNNELKNKVEIHRLLSGGTRYKLIKLLNELDELCVCDMAEILNTTVSAVSHQLKLLRNANKYLSK